MADLPRPLPKAWRKRNWARYVANHWKCTGSDRLVALSLALCCDNNGFVQVKNEKIQELAQLGERQVRISLNALLSLGLIELIHSGGGRGHSASYKLKGADCATVYGAQTGHTRSPFIREGTLIPLSREDVLVPDDPQKVIYVQIPK